METCPLSTVGLAHMQTCRLMPKQFAAGAYAPRLGTPRGLGGIQRARQPTMPSVLCIKNNGVPYMGIIISNCPQTGSSPLAPRPTK
eukprot:CAMPEP_0204583112 /NCGR_PEP_ID=MMETSP0661-20131031/45596_1 /ASSEMBLY_ACC=CAM_ASM_000606 /TAXON_ID=109239 /ORGANISM="Alexandrium margalefi, Strain AMGDE01CS-322" /LENGTH=85 /DNA_ID=CAMNT_0051592445 /DNA_START=38 /DNA_END=292 /DNA_ORIENTATION=-